MAKIFFAVKILLFRKYLLLFEGSFEVKSSFYLAIKAMFGKFIICSNLVYVIYTKFVRVILFTNADFIYIRKQIGLEKGKYL